MGEGAGYIGGLAVFVVPSWVHPLIEWRWVSLRPGKCPPVGRRKGTRKMWKRAHPKGLRWRAVSIPQEPDHVLQIDDKIFCTAHQYAELNRRLADTEAA